MRVLIDDILGQLTDRREYLSWQNYLLLAGLLWILRIYKTNFSEWEKTISTTPFSSSRQMMAIRRRYMETVWTLLKRYSLLNFKQKYNKRKIQLTGEHLYVGAPVLCFRGRSNKLNINFELGHITKIISLRTVKLKYSNMYSV